MYNSIDKRETMACIFIDYSKAFDIIDHDIFCRKLEYYGMGNDIIRWCKSYLAQQTQNVNTTLYNIVRRLFSQHCEKDVPATLLQHKMTTL